jgi:hypothetical protein
LALPETLSLSERLSLIAKGVPKVASETAPDQNDLAELVAIEVAKKHAELENEWLLIGLRKSYGRNIIRFLWTYFIFACICMIVSAFHPWGFALPEGVQVALVGGTAVSVIGVVGTVAAGLFRPPPKS